MEKGIIATSTTSCYCSDCLEGKYHNTSEACLLKKSIQRNMASDSVENETANETEPEHIDGRNVLTTEDNIVDESGLGNRSLTLELKVGNYVAACYDKDWFIGKILEIDEEDNELLITFLQPCKKTLPGTRPLYKWPANHDELWVKTNETLCNVSEPSKHGRSGRSFEISQEDFETATETFALKMMTKRRSCVKFADCNVDYITKQKNNLYEYYYMLIYIRRYITPICPRVYIFRD